MRSEGTVLAAAPACAVIRKMASSTAIFVAASCGGSSISLQLLPGFMTESFITGHYCGDKKASEAGSSNWSKDSRDSLKASFFVGKFTPDGSGLCDVHPVSSIMIVSNIIPRMILRDAVMSQAES